MSVPILVRGAAEARAYGALLRDLLTRIRPGASGAVSLVGDLVVGGTVVAAGTATVGGLLTATSGVTSGGPVTASNGLAVAGAALTAGAGLDVVGFFHPPTQTGAAQTNRITMSTGVPAAGDGADGDVHVRAGTAGQGVIYRKHAGAWANLL